MNLALLSKLGWRLVTQVEPLWIEVLKAKYFHDKDFLSAESKGGSFTYLRKSILEVRHLVAKGIGYLVNTGKKASFWLDSWLKEKQPHASSCKYFEDLGKLLSDYWSSNGWNFNNLRQFLPTSILLQLEITYLDKDVLSSG
ncbi:hypothetical protein SLA2020_069460 [Shorea laevis]